ncbi:HAD hydrolase-like protein [Pseudomonas sp. S191]|uniref:HAD hydrolase-like protein n=1 Tax=Pseudomonas sp. S191 TaxID=579575 RepID=UPI00387AB62E
MAKLKGVILSVEDVLVQQGLGDALVFSEVTKLIKYLKGTGTQFVVMTNRRWTVGDGSRLLVDALKEMWGEFTYLCRSTDSKIPAKPRAEATEYVLNLMGWKSNEVLYIGASESDMQTAVNGGLLFLRATWYANKTDYGFEFDAPKDIARFIDVFCFRDHLWCHEIHDGNFEYYALAPFSTMKAEYTLYSEDARKAAKQGLGHPDFWVGAIVSSLYFSGIQNRINYITVYPGHKAGSGNVVMNDAMAIFGKCFRKNYLPDLIVRHTTAQKSQTARNQGIPLDHLNQLNTIMLNKAPLKTSSVRYKSPPLGKGKSVLLIDDICTRGYSLEAARTFVEKTGAKAILVSWLKTINTDIVELAPFEKFDPYKPAVFSTQRARKTHSYHENIVDHLAPGELSEIFAHYKDWEWPA